MVSQGVLEVTLGSERECCECDKKLERKVDRKSHRHAAPRICFLELKIKFAYRRMTFCLRFGRHEGIEEMNLTESSTHQGSGVVEAASVCYTGSRIVAKTM